MSFYNDFWQGIRFCNLYCSIYKELKMRGKTKEELVITKLFHIFLVFSNILRIKFEKIVDVLFPKSFSDYLGVVVTHVMSHHVMSRHASSYHVMSHHVMSCHIKQRKIADSRYLVVAQNGCQESGTPSWKTFENGDPAGSSQSLQTWPSHRQTELRDQLIQTNR